jgi:hypothetical protein
MLVTTVVVDAGTVYRVVLDVAAAPLASTLVVVAISYYLLIVLYHIFYAISAPVIWYFISVALANPAIIFVAPNACLRSKVAVEFAEIVAAEKTSTESKVTVNVADDVDVFVTKILVTKAVVAAGTVYKVADDVAKAPLLKALIVVATNYSFFIHIIIRHIITPQQEITKCHHL